MSDAKVGALKLTSVKTLQEIPPRGNARRILRLGNVQNAEGGKQQALSRMHPRLKHAGLENGIQTPDPEMRTRRIRLTVEISRRAWRKAGVVQEMKETDRVTVEAASRAGVPALVDEIDERLADLERSTAADLREVRREFSSRLKDAAPHVVIELATLLLEVPRFEYRFIGYELIHHHPSALARLNAWQLEQLGHGIATWSAVDCFAVYLAGPAWRERRVPNSLIHGWAHSADRWWRRAALVSTVPLNSKAQGGKGETYRTLQVCRILERDRDPMVVKALSWALRELAKRDPRAVREYVASRKDVLPALVLREVTNKLSTGVKNPRRKA
jgi:3-methyladenine DNA glycosylase AlkD